MGWHQVLSLLPFLLFLHSSLPFASPLCPLDQRDALLHFKNSFVLDVVASDHCHSYYPYYPKTNSWNKAVDCCSWGGVTCDNVTGNVINLDLTCSTFHGTFYSNSSLLLPKLEELLLRSCNLIKFPYFLNLSKGLTYLDLSSNMISGEIPEWFWGISHGTLEKLDISNNLLRGGIQQLHWKRLWSINLEHNSFQGPLPIPSPSTSHFFASNSGFTGEIPFLICQLSSLKFLDLSNNSLFGKMPPCFGNISNLEHLDLSSNKLQGSLPRSLVKCVNLSLLNLNHNNFSDIFPNWLEAPKLSSLDLRSNNFHGRINLTAFGLSFPSLAYLFLSDNNFLGWWLKEDFLNTSLIVIDLSNNKFGGPIPIPLLSPITTYYSIASNNFIGKIPSLTCNATKLEMIDLSNNLLTGSLPQCITNFSTHLLVLNLRMNRLEGTIPQSFSWRNSLMTLDLNRNWFEGKLPRSLEKCENLEVLNLHNNQIKDTFPEWLGTLLQLKILILRRNNFGGPLPANLIKDSLDIPKRTDLFPKLHVLDLSDNNFGGPLPANLIMNLKALMSLSDHNVETPWLTTQSFEKISNDPLIPMGFSFIDLSNNSFKGDIPEVIGHLRSLVLLNLSYNHLIGPIPQTLGNLTNLEALDLSSNKLCGGIPRALTNLSFLSILDLSNNQLTGRIPQGMQFDTFSNESYSNNPGLCGSPLPKKCSPGSSLSTFDCKEHEHWFKQKIVWIGYSSGIVIGISIAYIMVETSMPKWFAQGVRILERRVAQWKEKPKWKAIKFHGQ